MKPRFPSGVVMDLIPVAQADRHTASEARAIAFFVIGGFNLDGNQILDANLRSRIYYNTIVGHEKRKTT